MSADTLILGVPIAIVFMAVGVGAVILLLGFAVSSAGSTQHKIDQRVSNVVQRLRPKNVAEDADQSVLQKEVTTGIGAVDRVVRILPRPRLLEKRLLRTGLNIGIGHYVIACLITAALTVFICAAIAHLHILLSLLIGTSIGVGLPHMIVGMMIKRRRERFVTMFPEAIDLIVRGLRSGLPVTETINTVMNEIANPIGGEFRKIVDGLAMGRTLEDAMWDAADRVDAPEFRFFVVSMSVQRETGGNLAETLENLADILRRRRQTKLKIRALSSEARASALIIGALPFIMFGIIWMVNSEYLVILFTDIRGNIMLGVGLFWLVLGFGIMAKMVRFEI